MSGPRPVTRTGPVPQWGAPPAGTAVATARRAGTGTVQHSRTGLPTATVLGWWRAVLVVSCVAAAVFAPGVLRSTSSSLIEAKQSAQMMLHLNQAKGDLLVANSVALSNALAPGNGKVVAETGAAMEALTSAADVASDAGTNDDRLTQLAEVSSGVVTYVAAVSAAGTDANAVNTASNQLRESVLPTLDSLIAAEKQDIEDARNSASWAVIVWMGGISLLIVLASIHCAKRTRRVLNLGLVAALAFSGVGVWQSSQLVGSLSDGTSARSIDSAATAGSAYSALGAARDAQLRYVVSSAATRDGISNEFTASLPTVRDAVAALDPANQTVLEHIDAFGTSFETLQKDMADGTLNGGLPAASDFTEVRDWSATQIKNSHGDLASTVGGRASSVEQKSNMVAILMAAAAIASVVGLSRIVRRYR
ncbi:hypothetical protein HMPREF1531_01413 [Propionibacterium sp. oral taxon 192 str. F0372]|uniref:hypothetical protein n=1 Tax=Propionibacterium sp. oral taxon 192 TaxID=671222 RepID=UPI000353A16B|nr:hypothetical protein [Propionibacterium sp. oral taxon 192]EPH03354.1 hypothetical protein HMPREF1531_01413 [Propionibacterium sp. oral taxon 192 str. F0372]